MKSNIFSSSSLLLAVSLLFMVVNYYSSFAYAAGDASQQLEPESTLKSFRGLRSSLTGCQVVNGEEHCRTRCKKAKNSKRLKICKLTIDDGEQNKEHCSTKRVDGDLNFICVSQRHYVEIESNPNMRELRWYECTRELDNDSPVIGNCEWKIVEVPNLDN